MQFPTIDLKGGNLTHINLTQTITVTAPAVFTQFGVALFTQPFVSIELTASMDVHALGMGYTGIAFKKVMTIAGPPVPPAPPACVCLTGCHACVGVNQFQESPPQILSQQVYKGTEDQLFINLTVSLFNPAPVAIRNMGSLNMTLLVCSRRGRGYPRECGTHACVRAPVCVRVPSCRWATL